MGRKMKEMHALDVSSLAAEPRTRMMSRASSFLPKENTLIKSFKAWPMRLDSPDSF